MIKDKKFWISIILLLVGQAFMYWSLKLFQNNYHYINFFLDDKIPFLTRFIYIYDLFYPFIFLCFYYLFMKDKKNYYSGIIAGVVGFLICDVIFLSYPTIMDRGVIPNTDKLTKFVIDVTYYFDNPALNCFPSIHCLFCFQVIFSYLFGRDIDTKYKILVVIFSLLIISSTLFVKQHYFFDIFGALLVSLIANLITYKFNLLKIFDKKFKLMD